MATFSLIFGTALVSAVLLTPLVRRLAMAAGVVDRPDAARKLHARPVPLLGGLAVYAATVLGLLAAVYLGLLPAAHIKEKYLVGLALAGALLVFGGSWDDARNLKPWRQFLWPVLAALAVIASGIGVDYVTNPFGGLLHLDEVVLPVLTWQGVPYKLTVLADLFTLVWLLGMTYTTKFLDGLDGLVAGVTGIGALILAAVSLMREVAQPDTALLALALAGACFGFLVFNFHPARIFLGEGGSTLCGFLLGVLAIVSGGKIATALLVMGLPIFDAALVIIGRLRRGRTPFGGDRTHLHFRLLDVGFTQRQVVLIYYFAAALFGVSTLVLRGWEKVVALGFSASLLFAAGAFTLALTRRKAPKIEKI